MARRGRPPKRPLELEPHPSLIHQPEISNPSLKRTRVSKEISTELTTLEAAGNKSSDTANGTPRRSQRIQNKTFSEGQDVELEPIYGNLEANETEEEHRNSSEKRKALEEMLGSTSMEEKLDKLIQLLGAQARTTETLFSKVSDWCFSTQTKGLYESRSEMRNDKYKSKYVDSQEKIEDLKNENNELRKQLETALAKLEGYEKGQLVLTQSIDKLKDAFLVSNLTRTSEMVSGLTGFTAANRQATKRRVIKSSQPTNKGTYKVGSTNKNVK